MYLLADLVATSNRVAATRSRLAKLRELAQCLRALQGDEIEIGVMYLSGETRQGKIGIGYSVLRQAAGVGAANEAPLTLTQVDSALPEITSLRGSGSANRRKTALEQLFQRATSDEHNILTRLIVGEL